MCSLLFHRTNLTFFDALNNFDLVYFLLFLPAFTHLFTALSQKKTDHHSMVCFLFLLAFHPSSEIPNATPCRLILASLGFRLRAATVILSGAKPGFAESNCVAAPLGGIRAALSLRMTRNEKRSSSCNLHDFMLY